MELLLSQTFSCLSLQHRPGIQANQPLCGACDPGKPCWQRLVVQLQIPISNKKLLLHSARPRVSSETDVAGSCIGLLVILCTGEKCWYFNIRAITAV